MRITLVAGSNRANAASTNLLKHMQGLLEPQGITVTLIDLEHLPLPLFTPDNWDFHPNAKHMLDTLAESDGIVLATPEYHGSLSGALKNALDYVNPTLIAGKPVLSVSSAGGPLGVSSLTHLQTIVRNLHGINCSEWISIGSGTQAFDADGNLTDEEVRARVSDVLESFVQLTRTLGATTLAATTTEQSNEGIVSEGVS